MVNKVRQESVKCNDDFRVLVFCVKFKIVLKKQEIDIVAYRLYQIAGKKHHKVLDADRHAKCDNIALLDTRQLKTSRVCFTKSGQFAVCNYPAEVVKGRSVKIVLIEGHDIVKNIHVVDLNAVDDAVYFRPLRELSYDGTRVDLCCRFHCFLSFLLSCRFL